MILHQGIFTISLDFELYWGVRDKRSIEQYKYNLQGVREAIPQMLRLFNENNIHATWSTVGFLFFNNADELRKNTPKLLPTYHNENLSPYRYIEEVPDLEPIYHFAPELIELILKCSGQEIGTHTLSHYYCLEKGQTLAQFEADISLAVNIAKKKGISVKSLVFPRNQWNKEYLSVLPKLGVQCYRGNESSWIYKASETQDQNLFQRSLRLIDAYINLSGYHTYNLNDCIKNKPFNFPASRFLRPYSEKLAILEKLRLARIKKAMYHAATNNQIFHLWWHPHNFGINTSQNIKFLDEIIHYYLLLKKKHGMASMNMGELCHPHQ